MSTINNELQLQAACVTWFQNNMREHRGKFRRVRNETDLKGKHGMIQGQINKATGIVSGTWDSFFIVSPIHWIEFKWGNNGLSPNQKEFAKLGTACGWRFHVIKTLDQFIRLSIDTFETETDLPY